jgi:arylamine N-acetyltransferase
LQRESNPRPAESEAIERLAAALHIPAPEASPDFLQGFIHSFSRIAYENLSKIVLYDTCKDPEKSLRTPEVLIEDHFTRGAGGACFSLTYLASRMLRQFGIPSRLITGDRNEGKDTHCAVVCPLNDGLYLLDVGFLLFEPVLLDPARPTTTPTPFSLVETVPCPPDCFHLYTSLNGPRKHRATLKMEYLDDASFRRCWIRTFQFEMMGYPVVTRITGRTQCHLRGTRWVVRTPETVEKRDVTPEDIPGLVEQHFGISRDLAARAVHITLGRGH